MELYPTIDDNDEEVYPDFVRDKSLDLFYYGQQFEDVLMSVFDQKETASINDYINALNYYMEMIRLWISDDANKQQTD